MPVFIWVHLGVDHWNLWTCLPGIIDPQRCLEVMVQGGVPRQGYAPKAGHDNKGSKGCLSSRKYNSNSILTETNQELPLLLMTELNHGDCAFSLLGRVFAQSLHYRGLHSPLAHQSWYHPAKRSGICPARKLFARWACAKGVGRTSPKQMKTQTWIGRAWFRIAQASWTRQACWARVYLSQAATGNVYVQTLTTLRKDTKWIFCQECAQNPSNRSLAMKRKKPPAKTL